MTGSAGGRHGAAAVVAAVVALGVGGAGCKGKAPPPPEPPVVGPTLGAPPAPDASVSGKEAPPVVTPKTVDELGLRIVEALVAQDLGRMKAYAPALDLIDRHCSEQAPNLRQGYAEKLGRAMGDAGTRAAECASLDWTGATLAGVTLEKSDGVPFYGCAPILEGSLRVRVAVAKDPGSPAGSAGAPAERMVTVPSVYLVGDAVYLGGMPRCDVKSPCAAIVKHLEELVAAAPAAPEAAPLSASQRESMVSFCDTFWTDQKTREQLACMRGATAYGGIAACGQGLTSLFVSWPQRGR